MSKQKNDKTWKKYKEDINQDRQFAPVFFTGHEFENIEKAQPNYHMRKHITKYIIVGLLAVAGLVIYFN